MPQAKLIGSAPLLLVSNVVAAANHYSEALGFASEHVFGEPPNFIILARDGLRLMLKQVTEPQHVVPHWKVSPQTCDVYFWVSDADALHAELRARGATIDYGPCDQPYGCREFGVQDLDGHDISFGEMRRL